MPLTAGIKCDALSASEVDEITHMKSEGFDTIEIRDQLRQARLAAGKPAQIYEWQVANVIAKRSHSATRAA